MPEREKFLTKRLAERGSELEEYRETLMRIGAELGLDHVTAHNAIDAIRVLKEGKIPDGYMLIPKPRKAAMPKPDYPIKPKAISDTAWIYEEPKGIIVCQQPARGIDAVMVTIPWRMVSAAVDRHRKRK